MANETGNGLSGSSSAGTGLFSQHGSSMHLKIGVMGSADESSEAGRRKSAFDLGRSIAEHCCVTVTGACPGFPLAAAMGARSAGGIVLGISPALSLDEHVHRYHSPADHHDILVFTGSGLMGREVVNIRSSDIVVIVGGRSGTLGELAIAYDEGKLIGVLMGTGGITEIVEDILVRCAKETGARVLYETEPDELVAALIQVYTTEHYKRPSCFCAATCCCHSDGSSHGPEFTTPGGAEA